MTREYRPVPEDERDRFDEILGYAFRPQEGPPEYDADGDEDEDDEDLSEAERIRREMGDRRGVYEDDDLTTVCRHLYYDATLRGEWVTLGMLTAVGSLPEVRRRGQVGFLLAESLEEYREKGCELSALWPFKRSFYERYGWATANLYGRLECRPDAMGFAVDAREDEFRRAGPDDWAAIHSVYETHGQARDLTLDRDEQWYRGRAFETWSGRLFVYLLERDGDPVGYLGYEIEDDDELDGRKLNLYEACWTDRRAFRNIMRFVYDHDSQVEQVAFWGPPDGGPRDVVDLASDREDFTYEVFAGPMVRVVDVVDCLEGLPYPRGVDVDLVLDLADDHAAWNDGQFHLAIEDGRATCEAVDARDPDVELDVNALSQVVVGYRPLDRLVDLADVEADDGTLADLEAAFPERPTFLREFF